MIKFTITVSSPLCVHHRYPTKRTASDCESKSFELEGIAISWPPETEIGVPQRPLSCIADFFGLKAKSANSRYGLQCSMVGTLEGHCLPNMQPWNPRTMISRSLWGSVKCSVA